MAEKHPSSGGDRPPKRRRKGARELTPAFFAPAAPAPEVWRSHHATVILMLWSPELIYLWVAHKQNAPADLRDLPTGRHSSKTIRPFPQRMRGDEYAAAAHARMLQYLCTVDPRAVRECVQNKSCVAEDLYLTEGGRLLRLADFYEHLLHGTPHECEAGLASVAKSLPDVLSGLAEEYLGLRAPVRLASMRQVCDYFDEETLVGPSNHELWSLNDACTWDKPNVVIAGSALLHATAPSVKWKPRDVDLFAMEGYARRVADILAAQTGATVTEKDGGRYGVGRYDVVSVPNRVPSNHVRPNLRSVCGAFDFVTLNGFLAFKGPACELRYPVRGLDRAAVRSGLLWTSEMFCPPIHDERMQRRLEKYTSRGYSLGPIPEGGPTLDGFHARRALTGYEGLFRDYPTQY